MYEALVHDLLSRLFTGKCRLSSPSGSSNRSGTNFQPQLSCQRGTAYNTNTSTKVPIVNNQCNMHSLKHATHTICQTHQIKKHIHGKAHLAVAVCKCAD